MELTGGTRGSKRVSETASSHGGGMQVGIRAVSPFLPFLLTILPDHTSSE